MTAPEDRSPPPSAAASDPDWLSGDLELARAVLDTLPDHIYVKDRDGRYRLVNRAGLRERDVGAFEEAIGKTAYDVFPTPVAERLSAEDQAVMASGQPLVNREAETRFPGVAGGNGARWHITTKAPICNARGEVIGLVGVNRDITERKLAELALRESEQTFRAVFDQAAVGIALISPDLRYIECNNRFCEMLGYTREELLTMDVRAVNALHARAETVDYLAQLLSGSATERALREKELLRKDGSTLWVTLATSLVRDSHGQPRYFVSVVQDISDAKRAAEALRESEERFRQLAQYDALTQLPNRALFHDRLRQALAQAERHGWTVAVLFADVDRFKQVNDSRGHAAGDMLLNQVAARLTQAVRSSDTVARLGGDEFGIVLNNLGEAQDAGAVARKIIDGFQQPFLLEGQDISASASIGIALFPADGPDQEALVKNADTAMYRAKAAGRNCFRFYQPVMNTRAIEITAMRNELERAFEHDELVLRYQPRVGTADSALVGAQGLLAWARPGLGMVSPGELLPLLEETGLTARATGRMLEAACTQLRQWQRAGVQGVKLTLALSAAQVGAPELASIACRTLSEHRVDPGLLEIEVPELAVTARPEATVATLRELEALGLARTLGAFGGSPCSLELLGRLPVGGLKVPGAVVRGLPGDSRARILAGATIALAHAFGMRAVAEGVELSEQLAALAALGCDQAEGDYFGAPLTAAELGARLSTDRRLRQA